MNENKFTRYLRFGYEEYLANPDLPSEEGGFLIPEKWARHKPGVINRLFRYFGNLFNIQSLYDKGCVVVYLRKALKEYMDN